jgi:hypothetical protein
MSALQLHGVIPGVRFSAQEGDPAGPRLRAEQNLWRSVRDGIVLRSRTLAHWVPFPSRRFARSAGDDNVVLGASS